MRTTRNSVCPLTGAREPLDKPFYLAHQAVGLRRVYGPPIVAAQAFFLSSPLSPVTRPVTTSRRDRAFSEHLSGSADHLRAWCGLVRPNRYAPASVRCRKKRNSSLARCATAARFMTVASTVRIVVAMMRSTFRAHILRSSAY